MGYVSAEFDPQEYNVSVQHPDLTYKGDLPLHVEDKLYILHTACIMPLWGGIGERPFITSAFRTPKLSTALGSTSIQHERGEAVDFSFPDKNMKLIEAFEFIQHYLDPQTGWCYLGLNAKEKRPLWIHWALPLNPRVKKRTNPRRYWYMYSGGFHTELPLGM